jgi:hypothetical protein
VIGRFLLGLALAALIAGEAAAQKDVADPLEHFLGTAAPGRAKRALDDGVARTSGDFNNDGLPDLALWQEPDFGPHDGPVFLYLGRKDGRYAASGLIVVSAQRLFQPLARSRGSGHLLVCEADARVAGGYAVDGFVVADLARDALPDACPAGDVPEIERLDIARYRANGFQAWIRR